MRKAVSKFALTASVVLAMVLTLSCDSSGESSFVGKWVLVDGSASWELLKDGTGIVQEGKKNIAISWKVVDKRFVITTTVWGSLVSEALDYKISGNKIIFTDDKGESKTFVKPQKGKIEGKTLTDKRDGKKYKTVIIGERTWMAENLNYEANGSKCYDNKPENCDKYGRLYDWNTAKEACPSGWHLPSDEEWKIDRYVGGKEAEKKLKSKSGWDEDGNGTDDFGFRPCRAATAIRMAVSTLSATAATGGVPRRAAGSCTPATAMWTGTSSTSHSCTLFVACRTKRVAPPLA